MSDPGASDAAFRSLLTPGETIIWTGQPGRGIRFRRQDLVTLPFAALFVGFAVFWEYGATRGLRDPNPQLFDYIFPLFGLAFLSVAIFQFGGRFFADAYRRARTSYAITNKRILIFERGFGERLREEEIWAVSDSCVRRGRNGSGSIVLGPEPELLEMFMSRSWKTQRPFALEFLPDIDRVTDIIRRQQIAIRSRA